MQICSSLLVFRMAAVHTSASLLLLLYSFVYLSFGQQSLTPIIQTMQGPIQGLAGDNFNSFLGIPYARPPVGNLRFADPEPLDYETNVYEALFPGHGCPQPSWAAIANETQSEDCLFLNIFTPKTVSTTTEHPVLVFIHGGGWQFGSGMMPLYWGNAFANDETEVILVAINYRLGALGWLVSSEIENQNFGFKDQQLALTWVQENIKKFGGDPSRVTIAGQSAGGISVTTHLTAPSSYPLFSQAIVQSGPPMVTFPTVSERYGYGDQFAAALGCSSLDCFRSKNVSDILEAQGHILPLPLPIPLDKYPNSILFWMPVIDNDLILGSPQTLINQNQTAHVPTAWGTTRDETAGYAAAFLPSHVIPKEYNLLLDFIFGLENSTLVQEMYPVRTPAQVLPQVSQLTADFIFTCSLRFSARQYANHGDSVHKYVFLHPPSTDPRCNGTVSHCADIQKSCHGAELDYIFHTAAYAGANFTSSEEELSAETLSFWVAFVKGEATQAGWPVYIPSTDNNLGLDTPFVTIVDEWRAEQCDFWDSFGFYGSDDIQNSLRSFISSFLTDKPSSQ